MAPKVTQQTEEKTEQPERFPVTVDEFVSGLPAADAFVKPAFLRLCKEEGIGGHKDREEWQTLYNLFMTQPDGVTWAAWAKGGR